MADERCAMCAEAGFPNVLAHFRGITKGLSTDGKAHPALCWDHKHGNVPRFIAEAKETKLPESESEPKPEPESEASRCGCGRDEHHKGRCAFRRQESKPGQIEIAQPRLRRQIKDRRVPKQMSLIEVLANLRGLLEIQQAEIAKNVAAVDTVIRLVENAQGASTGAEFLEKGALCATPA